MGDAKDRGAELPWLGPRTGAKRFAPKSLWGPLAWHWLHTQAINFPASPTKLDQVAMFARFWSFVQTLPCPECRAHATAYAREFPPDFSGSAGFQTWVWLFHNAVNYRLGKKYFTAEAYQETYREELARSYWNYV